MELIIYQCDKSGADCSEYEKRVMAYFPRGEKHELCIKCAREIFPVEEESDVKEINDDGEEEEP